MSTSIFKVITHSEEDGIKLIERLNYIRNPLATDKDLSYATFVSLIYPYEEMMMVKQCYATPANNTLQGKHFFEYVVSVPEDESYNLKSFVLCMREINSFLASAYGKYQTISCIHINTDNLHAHIIANNIDWRNGTRFNLNLKYFHFIREEVGSILQSYGFSDIK